MAKLINKVVIDEKKDTIIWLNWKDNINSSLTTQNTFNQTLSNNQENTDKLPNRTSMRQNKKTPITRNSDFLWPKI
jgi:hypothetical protein